MGLEEPLFVGLDRRDSHVTSQITDQAGLERLHNRRDCCACRYRGAGRVSRILDEIAASTLQERSSKMIPRRGDVYECLHCHLQLMVLSGAQTSGLQESEKLLCSCGEKLVLMQSGSTSATRTALEQRALM